MKLFNTNLFSLTKIQQSDIQYIHKGLSDKKVTQYYAVHFDTLEDTQEQMDWYADLYKNNTGYWWSIKEKSSNVFLGAGGFNDWNHKNNKAEIGFWLLPEHWGKGIFKEVMPTLIKIGFEQMNLNRIEGFVDADNQKCKQALSKTPFRYEGTMRECEFKNGEYLSVDFYACIKKDIPL